MQIAARVRGWQGRIIARGELCVFAIGSGHRWLKRR